MKYDAHLHIESDTFLQVMKQQGVTGIANASSPREYAFLKLMKRQYPLLQISAGIHPWKVNGSSWEDMQEVLEEVDIIGEIGLDAVWCDSDHHLQKAFFDKQLRYASKHQKPVILHLKGMETTALAYIKQYPNTYLVHWHSTMEAIQEYIDLDCYFTIGPSVTTDESIKALVKMVPNDRMLIETDGLSALAWCENREVKEEEYVSFLQRSIKQIAKLKKLSVAQVEKQIEQNYQRFCEVAKKGKED